MSKGLTTFVGILMLAFFVSGLYFLIKADETTLNAWLCGISFALFAGSIAIIGKFGETKGK